MGALNVELELALKTNVARLAEELRGVFGPETIDRYVRESLAGLDRAHIQNFLPVQIEPAPGTSITCSKHNST